MLEVDEAIVKGSRQKAFERRLKLQFKMDAYSDAGDAEGDDDYILIVGQASEVGAESGAADPQRLDDEEIEDEDAEHDLAGDDEAFQRRRVEANQIDGAEGGGSANAARGRELRFEANLAEEIDVGVVNGKVDEKIPRRPVEPVISFQVG